MAYLNGTATSPVDLLKQFVTFITANGWTLDSSVVDSAGWRAHVHRGSVYANMRAAMSETIWNQQQGSGYGIGLYLGTGYSGAAAWNVQAGGPIGSGQTYTVGSAMALPSGAITGFHFFTDASGDNAAMVVEWSPGIFRHLMFGVSIVKAGTFTGGPYCSGSHAGSYGMTGTGTGAYPGYDQTAATPFHADSSHGMASSFVRADVDTFTGKWLCAAGPWLSSPAGGYTGKYVASAVYTTSFATPPFEIPNYIGFQDRQVSALNAMVNLLPIRLYCSRDVSGYSLIGSLPICFYSNAVSKGFSAGSDYALGSDTYKLFPNFAIKKVP